MTQRLGYIDNLKGLAIILVVIGHVVLHCALGKDNWIYQFIYTFHMPLFIFISGLLTKPVQVTKWGGQYILRKVCQIMIPFFVWGVFASVYLDKTYIDYLFDYFKLGYWYLPFLFICYVLHCFKENINLKINKADKFYIDILLAAIIYIIVRKSASLLPYDICTLLCQDHLVRFYPFFFLGTLITRYNLASLWIKHTDKIITITLPLTIVSIYFWQQQLFPTIMVWLLPILIIALLFTLFICIDKENIQISYLSFIGQHTLCIYMLHFFLYKYVNFQDWFMYLFSTNNHIAILFAVFIISILMIGICLIVDYSICQSQILSGLFLGKSIKSSEHV